MMGTFSKLALVIKAKIRDLLDNMENPEENLEASWQKQLEILHQLQDSLYKIRTSRKMLEGKMARILYDLKKARRQTNPAGNVDTENALSRLKNLEKEIEQLKSKEKDIASMQRKLQREIESFRNYKELLKAKYSAAATIAEACETASGIAAGLKDARQAMSKLNDTVLQLEASAAAIDELARDDILQNTK